MDALQVEPKAHGDELTVETASLSPMASRDLIDALAGELVEFAFQREKVLEKLDLRAAKKARRAAQDLRAFMKSALEAGSIDDSALSSLLGAVHDVLSGGATAEAAPDSDPPESLVSAVRRITRKVPAVVPMYGEDEPTLPGHRRAAIVSLVGADDEDDDKTAAGLPNEVLAQYLREVRAAAV